MSMQRAHRPVRTALLGAALALVVALPGPAAAVLDPAPAGASDLACTAESEPNELPEQAPIVAGPVCLTGTLPELRDQDLVLWDVTPVDALSTWRFTVVGIPETITSIWVYEITSEDGVYPPLTRSLFRVDSDATSDTPGLSQGVALEAGRYLLGIARGNPADGHTPPPDEYRITIEHELAIPPTGDTEPNNDAATATPIATSGAFSGIAGADRDEDHYRWTLGDADIRTTWRIDATTTPREPVQIELRDAAGTILQSGHTTVGGEGHLYDLAVPAGTYDLVVRSSSGRPAGYVLSTAPSTDPAGTWDPEPDDQPGQAVPVAIGTPVPGRLAGARDIDQFTFRVPPELDGHLFDTGIATTVEADRQLCLVAVADGSTRCRAGRGPITLSNERLATGDYRVQVDGDEELTAGYTLTVTDTGAPEADREVEPNDTAATASTWDPGLVLRGRSANGDLDVIRIPIAGDAQVWRLDATGTGIRSLQWVEPDGEVRGTADISADGTRASLWDMALVPGDAWIAIETRGEDYTLALTPLGPVAQGAEREPNNDRTGAEPIDLDLPRTGRLPGAADTDVYRFSLGTAEQITVRLDPPADAAIRATISSGTESLARLTGPVAGVPWIERMALPAGDYEITLTSASGSVDPYTLTVTREDPFAVVDDLEPNDQRAQARPVGADLHVDGRGFGSSGEDDDWYAMPALTAEAPVTITTTGAPVLQELRDTNGSVRVERSPDNTTWTTGPLPAGTTLFLNVSGTGDYTLDIASDGLPASVAPEPLPVTATLALDTPEIAAYTGFGQRVAGTLTLEAAADTEVTLDALTSHPEWQVLLDQRTVAIPAAGTAGGPVTVPVTVLAARDAWADEPVRVTVRAQDDTGRKVTAAADITPRRDVPLVAPEAWWPVPAAMLGGLDVASTALGGAVVPSADSRNQELLHDGLAMTGIGWTGRLSGTAPVTLTVDLAGDAPVPVAGFILDPLSQQPALSTSPRHIELLLSDDGTHWRSVLTAELSPRTSDQAFVLAAPEPARFAQLRIIDSHGGPDTYVNLGEWQVIAAPDWDPGRAFNLADPALGGHVAWMEPGASDPRQPDSMLSEAAEPPYAPWIQAGTPLSWAIAFADDRAARVTELQWVDAPGTDPTQRFETVEIAVGDSALGPWQELGTWTLARADDGSVAPFVLPQDTWARFIRFSATAPAETAYRAFPTTIRALELPVGGEYRSVLGAWGRGDSTAIAELLDPPDPSALELAFDLTDGNDTPESATELAAEVPAEARIRRGQDVDWYTLTVPEGDNVLEIAIDARPDAGLVVTAEDAAGTPLELEEATAKAPGQTRYVAEVAGGTTYRVRVEQAPLSTVFTWDESGSMGQYLSYVKAALRGFAQDIIPGEEAVMVMPFGDKPLLADWSDDAYAIESAIAGAFPGSGSSAAETSIASAAEGLGTRPGARAILAITDGETTSYADGANLWSYLDEVRPVVFTVHVAGGGAPALSTDLMQDWASWGGRYEYASSYAQIDRAFDRLATWLRRPAAYAIAWTSRYVNRTPGTLSLVGPGGAEGAGGLVAGSGVAVEILFDTSGSMLQKMAGGKRIDVAKKVLKRFLNETLSPGLPTALRIFKPGKGSCTSQLVAPLGPLDPAAMTAIVNGLKIDKKTKTPLAATLKEVASDLAKAEGLRLIVLITDGEESCKGDPEAVIRDLVASGLDVRVNIVGFAIDDEGLKEQMARWAEVGNGQSFDASGAEQLAASIAAALAAPFRVLDPDGIVVGTGVVGGAPLPLPPGMYRVEVLTDPPIILDPVEIPAEENVRLTLEPSGASASPAP